MEALTDLKHILHSSRDKYITKTDGNEALVGYFYLLNLLNRNTIKLHLIEKTNSTIISIPFVFSHIFTSIRANIFYHAILNNRLKLTKFQFILKKPILNRSNSTCLDKCSNCGENAIVKNRLLRGVDFHQNLKAYKQSSLFNTTAQDNMATTCSQIKQQAVAQLIKNLPRGVDFSPYDK